MKFSKKLASVSLATIAISFATPFVANASTVVLDFEGVGDVANIQDFYNGGTDSAGNMGTDFGVEFSSNALGVVDVDAGGTGNFANEPSPNTILFFLSGSETFLNYTPGFDTGFSFFYTSLTNPGFVNVYDGLNGTGNILATLNLLPNSGPNQCSGDPNGQFCNFTAIGVNFAGTAFSIGFGGVQNQIGFDNITFGSATPGGMNEIPVPGALPLLITGVAGLFAASRRRKTENG